LAAIIDGLGHFGGVGQGNAGLHFARRRVVDVGEAARGAGHMLAADVMGEIGHEDVLDRDAAESRENTSVCRRFGVGVVDPCIALQISG
jgi:hypothetical protein